MMSRSEQGAYFEGKGWQPLPLMTDQYTPLSLPLESSACVLPPPGWSTKALIGLQPGQDKSWRSPLGDSCQTLCPFDTLKHSQSSLGVSNVARHTPAALNRLLLTPATHSQEGEGDDAYIAEDVGKGASRVAQAEETDATVGHHCVFDHACLPVAQLAEKGPAALVE